MSPVRVSASSCRRITRTRTWGVIGSVSVSPAGVLSSRVRPSAPSGPLVRASRYQLLRQLLRHSFFSSELLDGPWFWTVPAGGVRPLRPWTCFIQTLALERVSACQNELGWTRLAGTIRFGCVRTLGQNCWCFHCFGPLRSAPWVVVVFPDRLQASDRAVQTRVWVLFRRLVSGSGKTPTPRSGSGPVQSEVLHHGGT